MNDTKTIASQIAGTISTYDKLMDLKKDAWHFRLTNNPNNSFHGKEDSPLVMIFNFTDTETARRVASQISETIETGTGVEGEGPFLTCYYSGQTSVSEN